MGRAPRVGLRASEAVGVLTTLTALLGADGRDRLRSMLLTAADNPDARKLLNWLNDFERVRDWRDRAPETGGEP